MAKINQTLRDKIVTQALLELKFARNYKQGKVLFWQKNENLYYGKKNILDVQQSRANVDLGRMQEFVHTLLSKIDNPLIFKFTKTKNSQTRRVERLNALRELNSNQDFWDLKDLVGKKQAIIYGRAIYSYYADSIDGVYKGHLEPVDVYDFLIDPAGGGIDIEKARYMGRYGVVKTKEELKGNKDYIQSEVDIITESQTNISTSTQEEINKKNRTADTNVWRQDKENPSVATDKYKFWEWYTTYEGERYYILLQENAGRAIRVEKLEDIFASKMYPFWSWAAFPDLTEFWTPSYADYVREIFMAQYVSINQMLDNAEQVNKPMKVVNVGAIENLAELKYRRDGYIKTKGDFDATRAIQVIPTPSINTPIQVFNILESIQEKASGVTAGAKGVSGDDKVGIYEGNQANAADRFGLLNKSYAFGYKRFAKLFMCGVSEHLTKKVSVQILGPLGIETEEISKKDIFYKNEEYPVIVEASDAELATSVVDQKNKLQFLSANSANPLVNQRKSFEIQAKVAGFNEDEIKSLLDTTEYGQQEILAEAERDIEYILDGKQVKPNLNANLAYKQVIADYLKDHMEDMTSEQYARLVSYTEAIEPIIIENSSREFMQEQIKSGNNPLNAGAEASGEIINNAPQNI